MYCSVFVLPRVSLYRRVLQMYSGGTEQDGNKLEWGSNPETDWRCRRPRSRSRFLLVIDRRQLSALRDWELRCTLPSSHRVFYLQKLTIRAGMVARSVLAHRLRLSAALPYTRHARALTTQQHQPPPSTQNSRSEPPPKKVPLPPQTWLTKRVEESPMARAAFVRLITLMGYGSAKQYAGRRAFAMYSNLCVPRSDAESAFWKEGVFLSAIIGYSCRPRRSLLAVKTGSLGAQLFSSEVPSSAMYIFARIRLCMCDYSRA